MRSKPFILDKTTGEPTVRSPGYDHYPAWKLIVKDLTTGKRKVKLHKSYIEAKQQAAEIQEQFGNRVEAHVVSRQMGYGPPYSKITDYKLLELNENRIWWCPYCRKLRKFLWLPIAGMRACEFCRTHETDWHVQRCNPILWEKPYLERVIYLGGEDGNAV